MMNESGDRNDYVVTLAIAWATRDPLERWVLGGPQPLNLRPDEIREVVHDYLAEHDPFPAGTVVDVAPSDGGDDTWSTAIVLERTHLDEWTVEYDDGFRVWRSSSELRASKGFGD